MEVTEQDIARIPRGNLRVSRDEFVSVWLAAERELAADRTSWAKAGVAVTCRWLADAIVRKENRPWRKETGPITGRGGSAYEEVIEAECLAAEKILLRRPVPVWVHNQPGWVESVLATLNWAWRRSGPPPVQLDPPAAG